MPVLLGCSLTLKIGQIGGIEQAAIWRFEAESGIKYMAVVVKKPSYGIWAISALFAAAIVYSVFFAGSVSNQQLKESCYERRARGFPTDLPEVFKEQIIIDCEMELRKSKGLR